MHTANQSCRADFDAFSLSERSGQSLVESETPRKSRAQAAQSNPTKAERCAGPDTSHCQGSACLAPDGLCGRRAIYMGCLSFLGGCIGQAAPLLSSVKSNEARPGFRLRDWTLWAHAGRSGAAEPIRRIPRLSTYRRTRRGQ
jgi:hypothetical protein